MNPKKLAGTLVISALLGSAAQADSLTELTEAQSVLNSINLSKENQSDTAAKLRSIDALLKRAKLEQLLRTGSDTEDLR